MGRWRLFALASVGYLLVAAAVSWPLPLHLFTHLPGDPAGDTGVYVWNLWLFHHEVGQDRLPIATDQIFGATGSADLTQHNGTIFAGLLAYPLLKPLGIVGAFNLVYLLEVAATGLGMFVLCLYLTKRPLESWLAGVVFAASPALIARGSAHFSLVAVMPVPLFVRCLMGALESGRARWAVLSGVMLAWAAYCDPYFSVYCVLLAGVLVAGHLLTVQFKRRKATPLLQGLRQFTNIGIGISLALVAGIVISGGGRVSLFGRELTATSLYTPMLILTVLVVCRVWLSLEAEFSWRSETRLAALVRTAAITAAAGAACLSPWLFMLTMRLVEGRLASPEIYWRSSPAGVDLLAFVMPNPGSPMFGAPFRRWLEAIRPDGYIEFTAALPWTALAIVIAAFVFRLGVPRVWLWASGFFAACALGPFVHVWGLNTYVPGPWALLRYVPVIEWARAPSRLALMVALVFSVTFAFALVAVRQRMDAARGRMLLAVVAGLLAFELSPAPRRLHAVEIPSIYRIIAADPDPTVAVLELPTGIRDGTSSLGNFSALSQFYQTVHGKRIVGGYLSRVSDARKMSARRMPTYNALLTLSEGGTLSPAQLERVKQRRGIFVRRANVGYVAMETARCPPALRAFAIDLFDLVKVGEDRGHELFRVRHPGSSALQASGS